MVYKSDNVILEGLAKEYIIEKKLLPYIPFYTADRLLLQFHFQKCYLKRSAVGVITENPMGVQYILQGMKRILHLEMTDLIGFVKTIVTHITNGNKNEERLVGIMGGAGST